VRAFFFLGLTGQREPEALVLRQDKEFGLEVVDLAEDPLAAGPLARSTTRNLILDKALADFGAVGVERSCLPTSCIRAKKFCHNACGLPTFDEFNGLQVNWFSYFG
jgi:hypothetical protein